MNKLNLSEITDFQVEVLANSLYDYRRKCHRVILGKLDTSCLDTNEPAIVKLRKTRQEAQEMYDACANHLINFRVTDVDGNHQPTPAE